MEAKEEGGGSVQGGGWGDCEGLSKEGDLRVCPMRGVGVRGKDIG